MDGTLVDNGARLVILNAKLNAATILIKIVNLNPSLLQRNGALLVSAYQQSSYFFAAGRDAYFRNLKDINMTVTGYDGD